MNMPKLLQGSLFVLVTAGIYIAVRLHGDSVKISFEDVVKEAEQLSKTTYKTTTRSIDPILSALDYDQARDIRFKKEHALWVDQNLPFRIEFFFTGWLFNQAINIYTTDTRQTRLVEFHPDMFDYGNSGINTTVASGGGFSGFRVHYQLNKPGVFDELIVFQGASYFRALGVGHIYGLSARGLAIDTGLSGQKEEFPVFEKFWIERPLTNSTSLVIHALLNSPSLTGAYSFEVIPGEDTLVRVNATIFMRRTVKLIGFAPLTSMFWYGENSTRTDGDFRPEVHDSDGLLIADGSGEWIWMPLENPDRLTTHSFLAKNIRGFGLLQRDRNFGSYEDLEALYHRRPSAWVEPLGEWGEGEVRLVEIPTRNEFNDNIVAFWVPRNPPQAGEKFQLSYTIRWTSQEEKISPGGYCVMTRIGRVPGEPLERKVILNFAGSELQNLDASSGVEVLFTTNQGASIFHQSAEKNPYTGQWRAAARIRFDGSGRPTTLRAFLRRGSDILTETWTYTLKP